MNSEMSRTITEIELTERGKQPQSGAIFITNIQLASEFEQEPRLSISQILGRGISDFVVEISVEEKTGVRTTKEIPITRYALSVSEIVELSKQHKDLQIVTRNQVNHHIRKLEELGFVHKYGTLWVGKRAIDYYRRSSKYVVVTMATPYFDEGFLLDREGKRIDQTLDTFNIQLDLNAKKEVVKLLTKSELLKDSWRAMIADLVRSDVTDPEVIHMYHWLLDAYAMGNNEYIEIWRNIRKILFGKQSEG
ncbi:MAG: hypothetical protein OEV85_14455 [Candidatus Thorarchaeota archaeon]|nr:hypothetical protein [Candidatus Thorarchaeota archaeon]